MTLPTTTLAILLLGGTVLLAFASDALAQRFRVPDVLWLILFGLLAGPIFGIVQPGQVAALGGILGTAALVIILYDAGIDFNPKEARAVGTTGLVLGLGSFAIAFAVLFLVGWYTVAGGDLLITTLFGLCLAGVSGAVVLPIARRLGFPPTERDSLHLALAIEDTISVLAVTTLLTVVTTQDPSWMTVVPQVLLPIPLAVGFGVLGGFIAIEFLSRWQRRVYAGLATMGALFVVYGITEGLGGSGIMAALVMGVILGNDAFFRRWLPRSSGRSFAFDPMVRQVHNEIAFVLRAIFLVILGILVPFQPIGLIAAIAIVALPFLLLFARRWLFARLERGELFGAGQGRPLASLYGRGLTNAVLLILAIQILPAVQSVLLPAFLIIIGTDVLMTVLVFVEPPVTSPKPVGGREPPDPFGIFRLWPRRRAPLPTGPGTPRSTLPPPEVPGPVTSPERPSPPGTDGGPPRTEPDG